jgi:hypothetical protein
MARAGIPPPHRDEERYCPSGPRGKPEAKRKAQGRTKKEARTKGDDSSASGSAHFPLPQADRRTWYEHATAPGSIAMTMIGQSELCKICNTNMQEHESEKAC